MTTTTTTDLMKIINDQYDPNLWSLALTLNVDFDATLKSFADRIGERSPLASCFGLPAEVDAAEAAKGAYWAVVKACKAAYLASISREAAEVIVRALPGDICLTLGRDLQFNANQIIDAWNEAHPDESEDSWGLESYVCALRTSRHVSAQRIMDALKQHLDFLREIEEG